MKSETYLEKRIREYNESLGKEIEKIAIQQQLYEKFNKMRKALEFYADKDNYDTFDAEYNPDGQLWHITEDNPWEIAQEALE